MHVRGAGMIVGTGPHREFAHNNYVADIDP
jgi:hypothetical protein